VLRLNGVLIPGDCTAALQGDGQLWFAVSLRPLRYVTDWRRAAISGAGSRSRDK
jgi:hypothetical protein